MNKLLKITLITAVMATAAMAHRPCEEQPFTPFGVCPPPCPPAMCPPVMCPPPGFCLPCFAPAPVFHPSMMPPPRMFPAMRPGMHPGYRCDPCCADIIGLTANTPDRACMLETTLDIATLGINAYIFAKLFNGTTAKNKVLTGITTVLALRSLTPSIQKCLCQPTMVMPPRFTIG